MGSFGWFPAGPAGSIVRLVSYSLLALSACPDLSRTLCSAKWPRLAVDANRASAIGFVPYSLFCENTSFKKVSCFWLPDARKVRPGMGFNGQFVSYSQSKNSTLGRPATFVAYSRHGKNVAHEKTRDFGRNFP